MTKDWKSAATLGKEYCESWGWDEGKIGDLTSQTKALCVLAAIHQELYAIRILLQCPTVRQGFRAMQEVDRHVKKRWPIKAKKRKPKARRKK